MSELRKRCNKCQNWKQRTADNFRYQKGRGFSSTCKVCRANRNKGVT